MGKKEMGDPKIRKAIRDKRHRQFQDEIYGKSDRDDDGNRLCEKCGGVLSDEPWEARVCEKCQDKVQKAATTKFHENNPGYASQAVMRSRKRRKAKKVAWLLARWPKALTHADCLDIMCNRCLKAVREIIPGAQGT